MIKPDPQPIEEQDASLTVKQVIEYGRDLARVYVLEKEKREQRQAKEKEVVKSEDEIF